jgi:hypothetical protein
MRRFPLSTFFHPTFPYLMFKTHLQNAGKITYNTNAANKFFKIVAITSKNCVQEEIQSKLN